MRSLSTTGRLVVIVLAVIAAGTTAAVAEDSEGGDARMEEMMKAWQAYMTPGEAHEELARRAGTWKTTVRMWSDPDGEPEVTRGSSEVELIMGGRYILERFSGTTPWGEFEGLGITAFDNIKQKYTAIWIDNMSTGIMGGESTEVSDTTMEYVSDMPNPLTGSYETVRSTETWIDDDTRRMESFMVGDDGAEFKNMEIVYERE